MHCKRKLCSLPLAQMVKVMKITAFLLVIALQVSARGFTQKITLDLHNAPVGELIREIRQQSGYLFLYNSATVKEAGKVTVKTENTSIEEALSLSLAGTGLTYRIIEKTIIISKKRVVAPGNTNTPEDRILISGRITDEDGKPMAGVTVINKTAGKANRKTTAFTDDNGVYSITAAENDVLEFSFVGYKPEHATVSKNKTEVTLHLIPENKNLNEIVITGYSSKRAAEITGSVQKITGEDLRHGVSTANTLAMLKGKAGGLYITENGGSVATRGQVIMRGQASFNDAANVNFGPLIVLDGVITTAANLQDIVDATDIESITILKDAASTAVYGSRAAQGVIVVTTKRGTAAGQHINLSMNYGKVQNHRRVNFMNTAQLTTHINKYMQSLYNATPDLQTMYGSFQNYFNTTRIYKDADLNNNMDWSNDAMFSDGHQGDVNLSLSGGSDKTRFYASVNWINQDGTLIDDNLDRKSFRLNLDQKLSKKLTFNLNANILADKYTSSTTENQYYLFQPWVTPYYANGQLADSVPNYNYNATGAPTVLWYDNPLFSHGYNKAFTLRQNYLGTGRLKYDIFPWLSVQSTNTYQYTYNNDNSYRDPRTFRGRWDGAASGLQYVNGLISITDTRSTYFLTSNVLNFNKRFGLHSVTALVGQEYGKTHAETVSVAAYNTPYPGERNLGAFLNYGNGANVSGIPAIPTSASPVDKASFAVFSEVSDNYKDKYFGAISLRRDASTNFGIEKRYGTFYSLSGGWLISGEDFMKNIRPVSNLKLRASYGTSGREAGADYLNFTVYQDKTQYDNLNTYGSTVQRLGNNEITWETTYTTNAGVDIGLWKRINLSIDLYNRRSSGLLQTVLLPSYIGFPSQIRNIGELTNKGVDILLSTENIHTKNFSWTTDLNINFNRNELTKIYGDSLLDNYSGNYYRYKGEDINVLKAIVYAGVNPDNGRPLFQRVMPDKSIVLVDSLPLVQQDGLSGYRAVGNATPKFFGGITNTFRYKGFTLSALFNFVYGNKIMNNGVRNFVNPASWQSGFNLPQPNNAMRFWQGPGDKNANYPNFYEVNDGGSTWDTRGATDISSSLLYVDASYIRLRNIRLGYDIPKSILQKIKISNANVYVSVDNGFTVTSKNLYAADPEGASIGSTTSNNYAGTGVASAMPRKMLFGVNVSF